MQLKTVHKEATAVADRGLFDEEATCEFKMRNTLLQWHLKADKEAAAAGTPDGLALAYVHSRMIRWCMSRGEFRHL